MESVCGRTGTGEQETVGRRLSDLSSCGEPAAPGQLPRISPPPIPGPWCWEETSKEYRTCTACLEPFPLLLCSEIVVNYYINPSDLFLSPLCPVIIK